MYFTKSDFRYFQRYRYQVDDALRQGKLELIFDIFRIYRLRVQQRLEFCLNLLLKEKDFKTNDLAKLNKRGGPRYRVYSIFSAVWAQPGPGGIP